MKEFLKIKKNLSFGVDVKLEGPPLTHTYIHNWSLQPFSQDYELVSYTTYVVCVNFIHKWRDLQFKVDFDRQTL